MSMPGQANGLLSLLAKQHAFCLQGFKAEQSGIRNVKISRGPSFKGLWRRAVGSYDWIPAGYSMPLYRAPTAEDAARYTLRELCRDAGPAATH